MQFNLIWLRTIQHNFPDPLSTESLNIRHVISICKILFYLFIEVREFQLYFRTWETFYSSIIIKLVISFHLTLFNITRSLY